MEANYIKHVLSFTFKAKTSRGSLHEKPTYFIEIKHEGVRGIGEASPLPSLSTEFGPNYETYIAETCQAFSHLNHPTDFKELPKIRKYPSIYFGLEMAVKDWMMGGKRLLFENPFSNSEAPIPINGLIWMGEKEYMLNQVKNKLEKGFGCIKIKIGGIEFETECAILDYIRSKFTPEMITIRLDANGAFTKEEALTKLEKLSKYGIHSIEQPIKPQQWKAMRDLCKNSPIPIALDEELIGVSEIPEREALLAETCPSFIILKPSLIGGFESSDAWIELAEQRNCGWWATSALESNIGLNAIAQFTARYPVEIPQGLGTGQLYHNNISSPLVASQGYIRYDRGKTWQLPNF